MKQSILIQSSISCSLFIDIGNLFLDHMHICFHGSHRHWFFDDKQINVPCCLVNLVLDKWKMIRFRVCFFQFKIRNGVQTPNVIRYSIRKIHFIGCDSKCFTFQTKVINSSIEVCFLFIWYCQLREFEIMYFVRNHQCRC